MKTHYKNEFGEVVFRPLGEAMHVDTIRGANLNPACMFDIRTAEKIALITDNRGIQIAPFKTDAGWRCYVVLHDTPSTAAVAVVETLTYKGGVPSVEIQRARQDIFI